MVRYWSQANPRALHKKPLHSQKVTLRCAMSASGIIGHYFLENEAGKAVNVNKDRYVEMMQNFFTPQLVRFPVKENPLFQHDGATSHTARMSMNAVNALFPNRFVSRNGDIPWAPRSPDLTPCDYFLSGYLKTKLFETRPRTIADLKQRIQDEVAAIPVKMLKGSWTVSGPDLRNACVEREAILRALFSKHKFSNSHKTKWLFICFSFTANKQIKISCVDFFYVLRFSCFIAQLCSLLSIREQVVSGSRQTQQYINRIYNTGSSKKMDGIWNRYNLKSTGRIYTFGVLKCSEKFKVN